jgi:hypothetical protein
MLKRQSACLASTMTKFNAQYCQTKPNKTKKTNKQKNPSPPQQMTNNSNNKKPIRKVLISFAYRCE